VTNAFDPGIASREGSISALEGGMRGVIGAMAMTGMRRVSTGLGLVEKTPPRALSEQAPLLGRLLKRVPDERRGEAIEIGHWATGAAGGVAYGMLPERLRAWNWSGVAYGLGVWVFFETVVAPLLALEHTQHRTVVSRVFLAADHALYGIAVGGTPWRLRA
jgi:uncharacterized membrane protein YagU involved in acid resistance